MIKKCIFINETINRRKRFQREEEGPLTPRKSTFFHLISLSIWVARGERIVKRSESIRENISQVEDYFSEYGRNVTGSPAQYRSEDKLCYCVT